MSCQAIFNDYCFLIGFLPAVLVAFWLAPQRNWKLSVLVVAGFVFYSFWDARFAGLLVVAALVDFWIAIGLERSQRKLVWLWGSVVFNLGVLAFFKYAVFVAANARSLFDLVGLPIHVPYFSIVLPIGISFYTFKTMSYTIDVYRGHVPATRDFLKYLAFICLFPDMVAGPIVRYNVISKQLDELPRRLPDRALVWGITIFSVGLFKKVVIADTIARFSDPLWATTASLSAPTAWAAALGYTLQLYFDFSGYSDMAIGLGALLGFTFPDNFNAPYQALNPSDFWRRWHISLSSFLRDYLYIPLGGSRVSEARIAMNLMIVMLLGGLWHGAAWTFVVWGGYHGLLQVLYRRHNALWDRMAVGLQRLSMFLLALVGWVVFKAPSFGVALEVYRGMITPSSFAVVRATAPLLAAFTAIAVFTMLYKPVKEPMVRPSHRAAMIAACMFVAALLMMAYGQSPFLYYQF